ncbi:MAG: AAA family ATPase [Anaerolineales bacterium]|nr:AAA family ATPase [Chloroflexota bacterium]MBL6982170.1 AAA family ATPase [Anaerolineales bacterium]
MENKFIETAILRIQTLGPFQTWRHQEILSWPTQKNKSLFQILLVEPGRHVPTDQILEYLWPDLPPRKAQNNLWVTVSQLRRVLQPDLQPRARSAYIHKQGEGYIFNSESDYWLDGDAFAIHLASAQSATDFITRITAWDAARILYKGDYLEDELYAEWAQIPRTQWRRRYDQLLINLAQAYGRNGRFQQAITHCREILTLDTTNETAYQLLMRCHAALGERATALKVYDEAVQALQDEIGVNPMPETAELARQIKLPEGDWRLETEIWAISSSQSPISSLFVGRGAEIDQFTRRLTQAAAGQGQIVLITGEAGIGKSRLVQETAVLAHRQGFHLLNAHCYQVEQTMPHQPLVDLIRQVMACDDLWHQLAPVWLHELAVLVPEVGEVVASATTVATLPDEPDENQQGRLFQAIFHLFAKQADQHKLLLVIEDIHWADPATLQCIHYLARHIARVPIVLIFTLRGENFSTDADLVAILHSLHREAHVTSLSLGRLTEADTTALLEQNTDTAPYADQLSHWLYQETDGNPFFFTSLLQSIREDGLLANAAKTDWQALARMDPSLTLPDAIRDLVRDRLQRLPQAEREVLNFVAVYGRRLDFSTLQAISHQPQMTLLNAVEQLGERQLLAETTGQYDFDHNKIREVIYYDLSAARRKLYHRQIAETMEVVPPSPDRASILAHHFERGGENEKALAYWMQAGEHALNTYAYQQTTRHYERALALADKPAAQMDSYLGLGNAFMLLDEHKAATTVIRQGLLLAERYGDDARRAWLLYAQAKNASRQHRSDGGKPEVEIALVAAEQAGDEYYQAQSLLLLTEVHESSGDLSNALETATRAQIASNKLNDNQLEARALVEIGFLHTQRAEFNEAVNAAELGLKLLAETDDRNAIAYAWNILGRALGGRGDYGNALDAFQRSQEEAQIIGDRYLLAQVFNMQGWLYRELGDYKKGLNFDKEGVDFAKQWGKPSPEISARLNVCLDMLHLGDSNQVLTLLDEIEGQINIGSFGFHNWRWQLRLLHMRGLCFLMLNEPIKALELAEEGLPLAETNFTRKYVALYNDLKGKALAELGNIDEAIASMETAIFLADDIQYQPIRWASRNHLAVLYHQKGRKKEAKNILAEAENIIQTIATALEDENLRATFLNAALPQ